MKKRSDAPSNGPGLDVPRPPAGTPIARGNRMIHPISSAQPAPAASPLDYWRDRDVSASATRTSGVVKPSTEQSPSTPVIYGQRSPA